MRRPDAKTPWERQKPKSVIEVIRETIATEHAKEIYGDRPFSGLQCTWPDKQGRLPHEDGFDEALRRRQPQLEFADAEKAGLVPLLKALGKM